MHDIITVLLELATCNNRGLVPGPANGYEAQEARIQARYWPRDTIHFTAVLGLLQ